MVNDASSEIADNMISTDKCSQMLETAIRSFQTLPSTGPNQGNQTADSLAALSTAFTFGSILLAVLVLIAGFAWAKVVAATAEKEARQVAKDCTEQYIQKWMSEQAPTIIQSHVELLVDATIGEGDDALAADAIGKEA